MTTTPLAVMLGMRLASGPGRVPQGRPAYRLDVRQPDIVPVVETLKVRAGESLSSDIRTALRAEIGLTLPAASGELTRTGCIVG